MFVVFNRNKDLNKILHKVRIKVEHKAFYKSLDFIFKLKYEAADDNKLESALKKLKGTEITALCRQLFLGELSLIDPK